MYSDKELYPDFFLSWNRFLETGNSVGFFEPDELNEIIEIYITEDQLDKARKTINYALEIYPEDDELLYDILLLLNDFDLWNDLLDLIKKQKETDIWIDGHQLAALLHLGMEEDAIHFFRKMKNKYKSSSENLSIIYQSMGESLLETGLFESSIDVMKEAISILGEETDFIWILLQSYCALGNAKEVVKYAEKIQTKNPLNGETWHRLGLIYSDIDENESAIEALENAQALGYKPKVNLLVLITAYEKNGNYNKVIEKAKEYLNLFSENQQILLLAAKAAQIMEKWEDAIFFTSKAINLTPDIDSIYLFQSSIYLQIGDPAKAVEILQKGIDKTLDLDGELQKEIYRILTNESNKQ